jgi:hypothetical protein
MGGGGGGASIAVLVTAASDVEVFDCVVSVGMGGTGGRGAKGQTGGAGGTGGGGGSGADAGYGVFSGAGGKGGDGAKGRDGGHGGGGGGGPSIGILWDASSTVDIKDDEGWEVPVVGADGGWRADITIRRGAPGITGLRYHVPSVFATSNGESVKNAGTVAGEVQR